MRTGGVVCANMLFIYAISSEARVALLSKGSERLVSMSVYDEGVSTCEAI